MKTFNIFTNEPDTLPKGKADFLLAASLTRTCFIAGIAQADISGNIALTPTLDAEFITSQKFYSMPQLAQTPNAIPIPALMTRAVHNLNPFASIEILNLGLESKPQNCFVHNFNIEPSNSIITGANINAKDIFRKGMTFGQTYELKGAYLILGESTPGGTITAAASVLALGYDCAHDFSLSFLNLPTGIKEETINAALSLTNSEMDNFEKLSLVSDNMLLFCAGFLLEASRRFHIVLAGGTQMAACLLIADALRENVFMRLKHDNITLATTQWVAKDAHSGIAHILSHLSYTSHAIYTEFSFENAEIELLKKYGEDEIKDGAGAGAALAYACANGLNNTDVLNALERIIYEM